MAPLAEAKGLPVGWHALWRLPSGMKWRGAAGEPWMRYPAVPGDRGAAVAAEGVNVGTRERLQVRVNEELVLDAGTCQQMAGLDGPERSRTRRSVSLARRRAARAWLPQR